METITWPEIVLQLTVTTNTIEKRSKLSLRYHKPSVKHSCTIESTYTVIKQLRVIVVDGPWTERKGSWVPKTSVDRLLRRQTTTNCVHPPFGGPTWTPCSSQWSRLLESVGRVGDVGVGVRPSRGPWEHVVGTWWRRKIFLSGCTQN